MTWFVCLEVGCEDYSEEVVEKVERSSEGRGSRESRQVRASREEEKDV
jgi:hypothetical protein